MKSVLLSHHNGVTIPLTISFVLSFKSLPGCVSAGELLTDELSHVKLYLSFPDLASLYVSPFFV